MNQNEVSMKKASSYYLVGTLFNKGIGFITVPIFTRILTVSDYGIVTTYNSWVGIATMIMSLALYMSVRVSFVDYEECVNDFFSSILLFTLCYGIGIMGIVSIIFYILPLSVSIAVIMLSLLQSLGTAMIENISQYWMMKFKYRARTAILVLPNLISTVVAIICIKYVLSENIYLGRIIPTSIITFFVGVCLGGYFICKGKFKFKKEYIIYGLKISLPLVLHGIALNILSQSDRTMITIIRNVTETGIYGLVYNFSMIATVITTAFDGIWIPYFTNKMKERKYEDINRMSVIYIELMMVAMTGVTLTGPEIVRMISTEPYWEGIKIIPPIVLSNYMIFLYSLYVNVEHFNKKTIFISVNTLIAAGTNIFLNIAFIKFWGYVGAAYATLVAYGLSLVLHYCYSRKLNKEVFPLRNIMYPTICIVAIVAFFYVFIEEWIIRWLISGVCLALILLKEKEILPAITGRGGKNV